MNFEPQRFFIGLIDFFSVLLPGALLTYLVRGDLGPVFLDTAYETLHGTEGTVVFLFAAYLFGHFVFLIGSLLLDDHVYDRIRGATDQGSIRQLARGKKLPWMFTRWLARRLIKPSADTAVRHAIRIKEYYLDRIDASSALNAFQWAKIRLTTEKPDTMAVVQRFEADSKFFRSLILVLIVLIPWALVHNRPIAAIISGALLLPAFWRYVDQREKATSQAYWSIITLEAQRPERSDQAGRTLPGRPSHAGGVVFRKEAAAVKYLLVKAKNDPHTWGLPKGRIEVGEEEAVTAVREVREESGVWARIIRPLDDVSYPVGDHRPRVRFYLMQHVRDAGSAEKLREPTWFTYEEATANQIDKESKQLLLRAHPQLTGDTR